MSATATDTTTAAQATATDDGYFGSPSGLSAATYYASIGVAVVIIFSLIVGSRLIYIRRMRQRRALERAAMARRGEQGGLPTYGETTSPTSFSYLANPLVGLRNPNAQAAPVPELDAGMPRFLPAVFYAGRRNEPPPPEYRDPPKYEADGATPVPTLGATPFVVARDEEEVEYPPPPSSRVPPPQR